MKKSAFAFVLVLMSVPAFAAGVCPNLAGIYSCGNGALSMIVKQAPVAGSWTYQITEYSATTPGAPIDQKLIPADGKAYPLSSSEMGTAIRQSFCQNKVLVTRLTPKILPFASQEIYYRDAAGDLIERNGFVMNGQFKTSDGNKLTCVLKAR